MPEHFLGRTFQQTEDFEWFLRRQLQVAAGADGLVFLPYVQGERAPVWDAAAKGVFFGIHARPYPGPFYARHCRRGLTFALYQVTGVLRRDHWTRYQHLCQWQLYQVASLAAMDGRFLW